MTTTSDDTAAETVGIDVVDPRLLVRERGMRGWLEVFRQRVRHGELGALPVAVGLIIIWSIFQIQNSRFLSSENLTNLVLQIAAVGTISVGITLVLLLGEIDLSVGSVSGLCAAVLAVLNVNEGYGAVTAIVLAVLVGTAIGVFQGFFITRFGVPSFVVTLAGLIGWQGFQLLVLGDQGTINIDFNGGIAKLTNTFFSDAVGYAIAIGVTLLVLAVLFNTRRQRLNAKLPARGMSEVLFLGIALGVVMLLATYVLNQNRGVPLALIIFVGFVVLFDLILRRTRYGRDIFAVGGNAEAARRVGINVKRLQLTVYMLCSTMAAIGGVLATSRLLAANQSSGGGDTLLNAIAAAVIGGTSLFGGRGSTYAALLGILVIGSVSNGMDLLQLDSSVKFIVTGAVLLAAASVDALSRRGRQASGRA